MATRQDSETRAGSDQALLMRNLLTFCFVDGTLSVFRETPSSNSVAWCHAALAAAGIVSKRQFRYNSTRLLGCFEREFEEGKMRATVMLAGPLPLGSGTSSTSVVIRPDDVTTQPMQHGRRCNGLAPLMSGSLSGQASGGDYV